MAPVTIEPPAQSANPVSSLLHVFCHLSLPLPPILPIPPSLSLLNHGHCPFMIQNCHLTIRFPLDFAFMPLPFLSTPPSCQCPLHLPCMSHSCVASHFCTSPVVPIGLLVLCFVSLSFPLHPLVSTSVPFMSLSVPLCFPFISRCFPVMSTSYFLPSYPCTSLHFPFAPQYFPQKRRFFQRFRKGRPKTQSFFIFSA